MRIVVSTAVVCLALFAAGCSTVDSRIKQNPAAYANLSASEQALVRQGRIDEGMSPEAVYLAWGSPGETARGSVKGRRFEEWRYFVYNQEPVTNLGIGIASVPVATPEGLYFVDRGVDLGYVTQQRLSRRVVFEQRKVVSWEAVAGL